MGCITRPLAAIMPHTTRALIHVNCRKCLTGLADGVDGTSQAFQCLLSQTWIEVPQLAESWGARAAKARVTLLRTLIANLGSDRDAQYYSMV